MKEFLRKHGYFPFADDMKAVFRRLDRNNNGIIKFDDFTFLLKNTTKKGSMDYSINHSD